MPSHTIDRVLVALAVAAVLGLFSWTDWFDLSRAQAQGGAAGKQKVDVLIGFKQLPGPQDRRLIEAAGGQVKREFHIVPAVAASVPSEAVAGLARNPRVQVIEPDGQFHLIATALDHTAPPELTDDEAQLELDKVWGVRRIGAGIVHGPGNNRGAMARVAVLDTGIDHVRHAQEFPDYLYAGGWDFVNNDNDPRDDNGHGTHVAGTIAAARNGAGVVGVAPEVALYALKVLGANGSGSFSNVIAALEWCVANGIDVSNNSYGSSQNPGSIVQAAFDNAAAAGVLHVAAAGNSGNPKGTGNNIGYPARYSSVIAVGATTATDARASYSSTGPALELAAPGSSIYSTTMGGGFGNLSGTSMASPHVAGVAALVIHTLREVNAATFLDGNISESEYLAAESNTNSLAREVLAFTAEDLGAAGHDPHFGYGLVDAVAAVALASTIPPGDDGSGDGDDGGGSGDPPPVQAGVRVDSILYDTTGPRAQPTRDLLITVNVQDSSGLPVASASVAIAIRHNGNTYATGSGATSPAGQLTFKLMKAPSGSWSTLVTSVQASDLTWDGITPENGFVK